MSFISTLQPFGIIVSTRPYIYIHAMHNYIKTLQYDMNILTKIQTNQAIHDIAVMIEQK